MCRRTSGGHRSGVSRNAQHGRLCHLGGHKQDSPKGIFLLSLSWARRLLAAHGVPFTPSRLSSRIPASAGTDCAAGAAETMLPCPSLNLEEILQDAGSESPGRARRIGADRAAIPMQRPQSGSPPFATLQVMKFNDTLDDFDLLQA